MHCSNECKGGDGGRRGRERRKLGMGVEAV